MLKFYLTLQKTWVYITPRHITAVFEANTTAETKGHTVIRCLDGQTYIVNAKIDDVLRAIPDQDEVIQKVRIIT